MKFPDVILLSVAVVFVFIGVQQTRTVGFENAYWAVMLALVFFFLYILRKRKS